MAGKVGIPRLCSTSAALADAYRSGQLSSKRCSSSSVLAGGAGGGRQCEGRGSRRGSARSARSTHASRLVGARAAAQA